MVFKTTGNKSEPVVLFFHAMGVTGESSMPVADKLAGKFYCIMPTSTVYCSGQRYCSKRDEVQQVVRFLEKQEIKEIELVVASSIGADLAMAFVTNAKIPVKHIFFDGGQFAQIGKVTRRIMVPFLYVAMKSLYWSNGKTLKKIMWCDDDRAGLLCILWYSVSAQYDSGYRKRLYAVSTSGRRYLPCLKLRRLYG